MSTLSPTLSPRSNNSPRVPKHATQLSPEQITPIALRRKQLMKGLPPPPMVDNDGGVGPMAPREHERTGPMAEFTITAPEPAKEEWATMDIDGMIIRQKEEEEESTSRDEDGDVKECRAVTEKRSNRDRRKNTKDRTRSFDSVDMGEVFYSPH